MASTESENFYRVVSLLVDAGTEVMRRLLMKYVVSSGANSVKTFLSNQQTQIFQLQKTKYLKSHQVSLLLGHTTGGGIDITTWDINLLSVLLKNICSLSQSEESAIEKLRLLRNSVYAHSGNARLRQSDFTTYWNDIECEIISLTHSCVDTAFSQKLKETISNIKTKPLSIDAAVEALKQWYSEDRTALSKLEDIDQKLNQIMAEVKGLSLSQKKSENPILEKIKQHSRMILEENNMEQFVETTSFLKARNILGKENVVVLCGPIGEGKTICALALAATVNIDRFLFITTPSQVEYVDPKAVDLFVVDDIFGRLEFERGRFLDWKARIDVLQSLVKTCDIKCIITSRTEIWRICQSETTRYEVFNNFLELNSTELCREEKEKILKNHLNLNGREVQEYILKDCVEQFHVPFGFPACANIFSAHEVVFLQKELFFKLPYHFIKDVFDQMDKETYITLLFLFYKKNKCYDNDLKPPQRMKGMETNSNVMLLSNIAKLVGINPYKVSLPAVHDKLIILNEILVKHCEKSYSFVNETIYDCVALYHGERYPEEVVEHCTIAFLSKNVHTEHFISKSALFVEPDSYGTLVGRIIEEIIENHCTEWIIKSDLFQNLSFCKCLSNTLADSEQITPFLSSIDDRLTSASFLETFIKKNPDQSCVSIVTQLMHKASQGKDQTWYTKLRENIKTLLLEKGYSATLDSLCSIGW